MDYCTLEEAAAELNRLTGTADYTANRLLRAGAFGQAVICVPLDTRAYSPTAALRSEGKVLDFELLEFDPVVARDRATMDMYGLFVVPARHLFALESSEETRLQVAHSLDGREVYFPHVTVRRNQLRMTLQHLHALALAHQQGPSAADTIPPPRQRAHVQREAILKAIGDLGLDPKCLPNPGRGYAGARSRVKKSLERHFGSTIFVSENAFDLAWDQAMAEGVITKGPLAAR